MSTDSYFNVPRYFSKIYCNIGGSIISDLKVDSPGSALVKFEKLNPTSIVENIFPFEIETRILAIFEIQIHSQDIQVRFFF